MPFSFFNANQKFLAPEKAPMKLALTMSLLFLKLMFALSGGHDNNTNTYHNTTEKFCMKKGCWEEVGKINFIIFHKFALKRQQRTDLSNFLHSFKHFEIYSKKMR